MVAGTLDTAPVLCIARASVAQFAQQVFRHAGRAQSFNRRRVNERHHMDRAACPLVVIRAAGPAVHRKEPHESAGALLAKLHQGEQAIDASELAAVNRSRHKIGRRGDLALKTRTPALVVVPRPPATSQVFVARA